MTTLYPYQKKAVARIKEQIFADQRPLVYAPTGAGKTVIAAAVFASARGEGGLKVFIVHTDQLRVQAQSELGPGVVVVTIQTLLLRPDIFKEATLVCFDECHHLQGQAWREAVAVFKPDCAMFGLSATPYACALDELFTVRITAARVETLIKNGYILPVSIVHPSENFLETLDANDRIDGAHAYASTHLGKQAVHFEPTISLCERAAAQYQALGIACAVISGETPATVRDLEIQRFRERQTQVLISPVLLGEGFDAPCAEVMIACRAFESDVLLQQAVGRIRRKYPGKTHATVVDCTGCCVGRPPEYFNATDTSLFSSLPEAKPTKDSEGRPSVLGQVKRYAGFDWVPVPEGEWVRRAAESLTEYLARAENADVVEEIRRASAVTKEIEETKRRQTRAADRKYKRKLRQDPAKLEKLREAERKSYLKRRQDPDKLEKQREAVRKSGLKRMQDPAIREALREAQRKRMQDPAIREAKREAYRKRMQDPAIREARREAQREAARKYRAAKKAKAA